MAEPLTGLPPAPTQTVNAPTPAINFGQHSPFFDVIDLLPPQAAERLRALRQRAADAHAVTPEFEQVRQASGARANAASSLKRLTDHAQAGGFGLKPDDQRVIVATKAFEKAEDEFRRVQDRQATRAAAFQTSSAALANVETWLRDGRPGGTVLEAVEIEPPKLLKGEDVLSAVERLRRRTRELKADVRRIESSPYPSSHAKAKMRAQIAALATLGAPSVSLLIEHNGEVEFQTRQLRSEVFNASPGAVGFAETPDAVALTCWLHRDALIAALDKEIATEADDKAALSHADREVRTSEVMSDLRAVEFDEAALVWTAQAQSLPVEHRADCDPCAILQVSLVTKINGHLPPTSPGQSYDILRPGGGRRR